MSLNKKKSQVREETCFRKRGLEVRAVRRAEPSNAEDVEDAKEKLLKSR